MPQEVYEKYSAQVLEETVPRAARFLNAIGAVPVIRTMMLQVGMTDEEVGEGGKLITACWSQLPSQRPEADTDEARSQREAVAELDQWDEPNFRRFSATLRRHHPSAGAYVFYNLQPGTGGEAVAAVGTFLKRIDALEKGSDPQREASKKDDKRAVELLAKRGLDKKERARLASLVELAMKPTVALPDSDAHVTERESARVAALTALKDWYEEWAEAARSIIKKRSYLIRMGLASRKVRKKDGG
ncbi:MAG: hypothetical protein IPK82_17970 [Polyangiaceae bacterium]|nr:hypothetical protein [Polyangiaceae bacterium]